MPAPVNTFKSRLLDGERLIGCWLSFAESYPTEVMASAGFDWLVIDGEHAPNDLRSIRDQLAILAGRDVAPVVRLPMGEDWLIKQVLDAGAQNLLIPMVESAAQARALVRACRYPPNGVRGVGAAFGRATDFGRHEGYIPTADAQICLLAQIESRAGLAALEEIAAVDGIDGLFIGPGDLAADMGHSGDAEVPEVRAAISDAITRIRAAGKVPGIIGLTEAATERAFADGAQMIGVGVDVLLLARAARTLAQTWKNRP